MRSIVDERIKVSLLEGSQQAVDSRAEKIQTEASTSRWASRQSGL